MLFKQRRVFFTEFGKTSLVKSLTDFLHKGVVKIEVVHDRKPACKLFPRFEKVADVGSRKIAAGGTVALRINGKRVGLVTLIGNVHNAAPCENCPVTGVSAWHYAVEQINAP